MKTPTIQEQYKLIKEGKGHKGVFMKTVRSLFPEYINQYTSFDDTVSILKSKSVLSEGIGGLVTTGRKQDWHAIFNENMGSMNYDSWKKELIDIIKKTVSKKKTPKRRKLCFSYHRINHFLLYNNFYKITRC